MLWHLRKICLMKKIEDILLDHNNACSHVMKIVYAFLDRLAMHLSQNSMKCSQNAKNEKCIVEYSKSLFLHFAFRTILCQEWHFCETGFHILFFHGLEIWMKYYEKCTVGVSYFMVCFAKTLAKYLRNAKYDKCIAGLTGKTNEHHATPPCSFQIGLLWLLAISRGKKKTVKGMKFLTDLNVVIVVEARCKVPAEGGRLDFIFKKWIKCWKLCKECDGGYFEKL